VQVSPANSFNDVLEHETEQTYAAVVTDLQPRERMPPAYRHDWIK
jgi:N-ethylmaleimide reductase